MQQILKEQFDKQWLEHYRPCIEELARQIITITVCELPGENAPVLITGDVFRAAVENVLKTEISENDLGELSRRIGHVIVWAGFRDRVHDSADGKWIPFFKFIDIRRILYDARYTTLMLGMILPFTALAKKYILKLEKAGFDDPQIYDFLMLSGNAQTMWLLLLNQPDRRIELDPLEVQRYFPDFFPPGRRKKLLPAVAELQKILPDLSCDYDIGPKHELYNLKLSY